jgi:hypothetical protein
MGVGGFLLGRLTGRRQPPDGGEASQELKLKI